MTSVLICDERRSARDGLTRVMGAVPSVDGIDCVGSGDELLSRYGLDIDADHRLVRCCVLSEFFVATYSVQPDLTIYRIAQVDDERNISQLFAAAQNKKKNRL